MLREFRRIHILTIQLIFIDHFNLTVREPFHNDRSIRVVVGSVQNVIPRSEQILGKF
jgi:hypothetical protein